MLSLANISTKFIEQTLQEIIAQVGGDTFKSYEFADGFKKDDSYLSEVYRVIVHGNKKNE
jgi:hypothetical protein